MKKFRQPLCALALSLAGILTSYTQTTCDPPQIVYSRSVMNLFTEEQDVFLGDVLAETLDKEMDVIADDAASAYLNEIGERLVRHLPPTKIKFRFFVVDAPELNAFSVSGGRIYVTRKLISFVKSEDELAGILGHEMGHAVVRHHSADLSKAFKTILNIDGFRDREDVYNRVHQLLDRIRTKRVKQARSHEDKQQLEADQIGLYAMTAAGYDPNANITAWKRLTETEEKNDRWNGLFGGSSPEYKRLQEMLRSIEIMPAACRERSAVNREEEFRKWRLHVVSIAKTHHAERLSGLISRGRLQPPLRGSIRHLHFSPDGRYIIARDGSGINLLQRDPFGFLFRIDVSDVKSANFSPDSRRVIIQTFGLRVEEWDLETRALVSVQEVYARNRCLQTRLSPDGKTLACYSSTGDLDFIDVATSEKIFTKEKFYHPEPITGFSFLDSNEGNVRSVEVMAMQFSPDGHYFVARAGMSGWYTPSRGWSMNPSFIIGESSSVFAFDVSQRRELKVADALKEVIRMPFVFYSNDKIVEQNTADSTKSGIFLFPSGERVDKFDLNASLYEKTTGGDYVIVRPMKDAAAEVYSVSQKKYVLTSNTAALDAFGDLLVSEGTNGAIELVKLTPANEPQKIAAVGLPRNELADIRTVAVSDSLDRIALSERARGAVWDLKTGARKIYIRGFKGSYVDPQGGVYIDLPEFEKEKRRIFFLDASAGSAKEVRPIVDDKAVQVGRFLVEQRWITKGPTEENLSERERGKKEAELRFRQAMASLGQPGYEMPDVELVVAEAATGKVLWTRRFDEGPPTYSFSPDGKTLAFRWRLGTKPALDIIKKSPELAEKARRMGEKAGDYLIQILNTETGNIVGQVLIETGEGSFRVNGGFVSGDWLTLLDSENRILFYSLKTGELKLHVFGEMAMVNPKSSIAVVQNIPGVLSVEDLNVGKRIGELRFPSSIIHFKFTEDGSKLFVLTAAQEYYIFDSARLASEQ